MPRTVEQGDPVTELFKVFKKDPYFEDVKVLVRAVTNIEMQFRVYKEYRGSQVELLAWQFGPIGAMDNVVRMATEVLKTQLPDGSGDTIVSDDWIVALRREVKSKGNSRFYWLYDPTIGLTGMYTIKIDTFKLDRKTHQWLRHTISIEGVDEKNACYKAEQEFKRLWERNLSIQQINGGRRPQ